MKKYAIINGKELLIREFREEIQLDAFLDQYSEDNCIKKESLIVNEFETVNFGIDLNIENNLEYTKLQNLEESLTEVLANDKSIELKLLYEFIDETASSIANERLRYDKKRIDNFHK